MREPPHQEIVSSHKGVAGNRGVGDEMFFLNFPPQGGGCVPSQGYERFEKKHTVVEANWLLLNVIVS